MKIHLLAQPNWFLRSLCLAIVVAGSSSVYAQASNRCQQPEGTALSDPICGQSQKAVAEDSVKTEESYDRYTKATGLATEKYKVPDVGSFFRPAFAFAHLAGSVSDAGTEGMELYVYYDDANGWMFFSSALDIDGNSLAVQQVDRQVKSGSHISEQFSASLTRPYLEKHQDTGLDIRFAGKYGLLTVKLPGSYVRAFLLHLTKIEASVREKLSTPKANAIATPVAMEKPLLGVGYLPVDVDFARIARMTEPSGVMVARVTPNGAGAQAGLMVGDAILTVDGKAVAMTMTGLQEAIGKLNAGSRVPLSVWRAGQVIQLFVQF